MRHLTSVALLLCAIFVSCSSSWQNKLEPQQVEQLNVALNKAGSNRSQLEQALQQVPADQLEGMAFLIAYMPQRDLDSLTADFLLENTRIAYQARQQYAWAQALPDSVFFNEVLPYAILNERRDNWRQQFYDLFAPRVAACTDIQAAIDSVSKDINKVLKTEYNVKRRKVDQSPFESLEQGMATCTGLSILMVDAFRSVGIPARLVGIPNWTTKEGNHNWVEVMVDGQWKATEYYAPEKLDTGWFIADAGKANPDDPDYSIYASSFKPAQTWFRLIWDYNIRYVHANNVTKRYIEVYQEQMKADSLPADLMLLNVVLFKDESCTPDGNNRVPERISLKEKGSEVDFGFSPSPTDDMNNYLVFRVKRNQQYSLEYAGANGELISKKIRTTDEPQMIQALYQN
ncbi:transglutaminase family protein [Mangrovibacterium marinum]|uniref:Transglutaminase superfamily protein n=1 Tax=Mangrovibacterium marinum TaxID=1639118 RepID=A0A2T5C009_9BACT|nr:transglutaminase domain-containing protein [Mangrovibacterium marinum]PTN07898.1 transglutaminase superfamily protein [Mangrovibacterium marinum]